MGTAPTLLSSASRREHSQSEKTCPSRRVASGDCYGRQIIVFESPCVRTFNFGRRPLTPQPESFADQREQSASATTSTVPRIVFGIFLLSLTLIAYFVPYYDWDLVAYTGAAIALHEKEDRVIQTEAYTALREELPEDDYQDIASGSDFRRDVAANPDHFKQQLRFYQIRPLYIRFLALLHDLGVGYVQATRLISSLSFFGLGLLLFFWAGRYVKSWSVIVGVLLLLITPVIFTAARTGSPDAISALSVVFGSYLVIERKQSVFGCVLLLLSLCLRTDNVVFVLLLLIWIAVTRSGRPRMLVTGFVVMSVITVFSINRIEHSYPWPTLMLNTENPIVNPADVKPTFGVNGYLSAVSEMVDEASQSSVMVFPFLAALALFSRKLTAQWIGLITVILLSWAVHVVLFPHIEDRYFVAGSAMIGVAALAAFLSKQPTGLATME